MTGHIPHLDHLTPNLHPFQVSVHCHDHQLQPDVGALLPAPVLPAEQGVAGAHQPRGEVCVHQGGHLCDLVAGPGHCAALQPRDDAQRGQRAAAERHPGLSDLYRGEGREVRSYNRPEAAGVVDLYIAERVIGMLALHEGERHGRSYPETRKVLVIRAEMRDACSSLRQEPKNLYVGSLLHDASRDGVLKV